MQVIPKDQMSTFPSYWPSSIAKMTSGAILKKQTYAAENKYVNNNFMKILEKCSKSDSNIKVS